MEGGWQDRGGWGASLATHQSFSSKMKFWVSSYTTQPSRDTTPHSQWLNSPLSRVPEFWVQFNGVLFCTRGVCVCAVPVVPKHAE